MLVCKYWQFLASQHPEAILPLYQKLNPAVGTMMSNADLFMPNSWVYNPTNYWNFTVSPKPPTYEGADMGTDKHFSDLNRIHRSSYPPFQHS